MRRWPVLAAAAFCAAAVPSSSFAQEEITFPTRNEDGATLYADRYAHEGEHSRGTVLLFHDQASNAHEYADIAPNLAALGFEAIAVDLRTGYDTPGGKNRTFWNTRAYVNFFDDGLPDAEGALAWAREALPGDPILLWGSGVSADFVLVMAAKDPEGLAGVLAFSPLAQLFHSDEAEAAAQLTVPLFVSYGTTPKDELSTVSQITDAAPPELLTLHTPEVGAHGAATLTESGNPEGWEANWAAMQAFLDRVAP